MSMMKRPPCAVVTVSSLLEGSKDCIVLVPPLTTMVRALALASV